MYEHNALGYWSGLALCLTKVRSSRACCPATALILKTRYALCVACFIKQLVNSCLLHSLCSSIDVKLQETHRISSILVLPSFNYSDLKT